jgi:signal transduction histidine kinase
VDFLFKPIVPEVLRAKAAVFVELQQRTAEVQRQAELLREMERRELEGRLQEERQRWEAEALREESQRKDEFLAVLAHELRNPLSPLVTGLELIKCYDIEHVGLERVRESMERQVRHLIRLVDDLLDVSRISRGKITLRLEPVELGLVLHQALESTEPLLGERRHELTVEPCPENLVLLGDQVRLTQVIANLLHNAARYTDPGGRIAVSCGRDGNYGVIRVGDNGRGIAPQMLDRIFDIFVQEREGGGGLGLGLTLVHRLVQLHGGAVRAYSEGTGRGSEFVVRLPLLETQERPRRPCHRRRRRTWRPRRTAATARPGRCASSSWKTRTTCATPWWPSSRVGGIGWSRPATARARSTSSSPIDPTLPSSTSACPASTATPWRGGCAPSWVRCPRAWSPCPASAATRTASARGAPASTPI